MVREYHWDTTAGDGASVKSPFAFVVAFIDDSIPSTVIVTPCSGVSTVAAPSCPGSEAKTRPKTDVLGTVESVSVSKSTRAVPPGSPSPSASMGLPKASSRSSPWTVTRTRVEAGRRSR